MKKYYDITNLLSTAAQYMILLGKRANGKSYQVKKTMIEAAYYEGRKMVYLRRWDRDIKQALVESYFGDMPVEELTEGNYSGILVYQGELFFYRLDEDGSRVRGPHVGRACALNLAERYKSNTFPDYDYIDYEEFITDKAYLPDEPRELQQFVSTVARDRDITVFLVGNTLSRVCPYFAEWCLEGALRQKQSTIEVYHYHRDDGGTTDIAVENCSAGQTTSKMFFGQASKQIISGEWDTVQVPKLPREQSYYDVIYELELDFQKFRFCLRLLVDPESGGRIVFVYPMTGSRALQRRITPDFSPDPFTTSCLDRRRRPEAYIIECFQIGKVCYSDNLTGADLKNVISNFAFM